MQQGTSKRSLSDRFLLIGAAVSLVTVGVGSFAVADHYRIRATAVILAWGCIGFIATAGWDYRKGFKSVTFTMFFIVWMGANSALFYLAAVYLSWLYWAALVPTTLWAGYMFAARVLNIRPEPEGWWLNKRKPDV